MESHSAHRPSWLRIHRLLPPLCLGDHLLIRRGVDCGVEQVLQQLRLQAHDGLLLGDEAWQ